MSPGFDSRKVVGPPGSRACQPLGGGPPPHHGITGFGCRGEVGVFLTPVAQPARAGSWTEIPFTEATDLNRTVRLLAPWTKHSCRIDWLISAIFFIIIFLVLRCISWCNSAYKGRLNLNSSWSS